MLAPDRFRDSSGLEPDGKTFRRRHRIFVNEIGREIGPGLWQIPTFEDGGNYWISEAYFHHIRPVGSIAAYSDGRFVAAADFRFYPSSEEWECVWLL
jgi:hypothetical protein